MACSTSLHGPVLAARGAPATCWPGARWPLAGPGRAGHLPAQRLLVLCCEARRHPRSPGQFWPCFAGIAGASLHICRGHRRPHDTAARLPHFRPSSAFHARAFSPYAAAILLAAFSGLCIHRWPRIFAGMHGGMAGPCIALAAPSSSAPMAPFRLSFSASPRSPLGDSMARFLGPFPSLPYSQ